MPIVVDSQTYVTAAEAAKRLKISRDTFTRNVGSQLKQYKFGALRRIYYLMSDVDVYSGFHEVENSSPKEEPD